MKNEPSQQNNGQSMPYLIPDADFNVKLKIHSRNIDHTKNSLKKVLKTLYYQNIASPMGIVLLSL